jgi:outer membrane protein assembly factor BamB
LLGVSSAIAQDWPQWRGANRDGAASGFVAPQTWPKTLNLKWKVKVGTGDATPALVGGKLYTFTRQEGDEVTICLDAASGKEIWKDTLGVSPISGPAARHPGPRSSPAVADGKVVTIGITGILSCLDANTGKVMWRNQNFKGTPKFYTASSPLILDDVCIAQLGGAGDGGIVAVNLSNGTIRWNWMGEGPGYSSPVLMDAADIRQIVALTEKSVVGIDPADGKLLWQLPFAPQGMAYNAATPIVAGQTVYITGQGRGTKAIKLERKGGAVTATELWSNAEVSVQFCSPVLKDGMLYAISDKGILSCLNAETGQTVWTDPTKRGGYGAMIDAGSVVMALPEKTDLVAFKPGEKQYSEVASLKVAESPTYASPVLSGKGIYIKDLEALTLWTFE